MAGRPCLVHPFPPAVGTRVRNRCAPTTKRRARSSSSSIARTKSRTSASGRGKKRRSSRRRTRPGSREERTGCTMAAARLSERWKLAAIARFAGRFSAPLENPFPTRRTGDPRSRVARRGPENRGGTAKPENRKREVKGALLLSSTLSLSRARASREFAREAVCNATTLHGDFWNVLEIDFARGRSRGGG